MKVFVLLAVALLESGLSAATITNGSFESPVLGASSFVFDPSGATWSFTGRAGIQSNGSVFGYFNAPGGTQTAFLQGAGASNLFSETITSVLAGDVISFSYALRPGFAADTFTVSYDGVNLGTFTPASNNWTSGSVTIQAGAAATGVLAFTGLSNQTADLNVGIDIVSSSSSTAPVPEPFSVMLFGSGLLAVSLIRRKKFVGR